MLHDTTSRRTFVAASGAALASLWVTADPDTVQASLRHALDAARSATPLPWETFTAEQATDVEAIAVQLIPTDDTPGAREAKAINFIDHALATWASQQKEDFLKGLAELNAEAEKRWPGTGGFASLSSERQVELLKAWEKDRKPFFDQVRTATIRGTFSDPSYGGNAGEIGWKLLNYEHRPNWQPPFGAYDVAANGGR